MSQRLYILSPSSAVRDRAAFRRGIRCLQALGYEVDIDPAALGHHQRFAATDEERLAAISRAAHSGADAVLISRGGYGLTRLLPHLPYDAIARSIQQGTRWVGLSDFTALQLALLAHHPQAITWAGPAVGEDFGADPRTGTDSEPLPDEIMLACFEDVMRGVAEGTGWRLPPRERTALAGTAQATSSSDASKKKATRADEESGEAHFLIENATLWGGNLSLLSSLVGTPYFPHVEGGILFVEDVGEHPYRIERMLTQLLLAGVLSRQRALLLGAFTGYKPIAGYDRGFGMGAVVQRLRGLLAPIPVITGLPFGHVPTKVMLPVGQRVDLMCDGRDVLLRWDHD